MTGSVAPSRSLTFQLLAILSKLIIRTINVDKSFCLILLTDYAHFTAFRVPVSPRRFESASCLLLAACFPLTRICDFRILRRELSGVSEK